MSDYLDGMKKRIKKECTIKEKTFLFDQEQIKLVIENNDFVRVWATPYMSDKRLNMEEIEPIIKAHKQEILNKLNMSSSK